MPATTGPRPFGRVITAMVTPFTGGGDLDLDAVGPLASYLVDEQRNDGLVVNGTGGEGPTTSDAEKADLVRATVDAVGDRAHVIAGVGTFDTRHSIHLAEQAEKAGAHALLVVTPYYSRPPQAGLLAHFRAVADATALPVMVYDIPSRSGVPIETDTMLALSGHERIIAVKDAKGDLGASSRVLAESDLAYYCGEDKLTLPMLAIGAVGVVGTSTHFCGPETAELIAAFEHSDLVTALARHRQLMPIYTGIFRTQGAILVKAGLALQGRPVGPVRLPLVDATDAEREQLARDLADAGLSGAPRH